MNGVVLARAILLRRPALVALLGGLSEVRLFVGVIPLNATLPCIGLTEVSAYEHKTVSATPSTLTFSRVQITAQGTSLRQCKEVLEQARYACRSFIAPMTGAGLVKAQIGIVGPDLKGEPGIAIQSQDIHVTFTVPPSP